VLNGTRSAITKTATPKDQRMRISYDAAARAAYAFLSGAQVASSRDFGGLPGVVIDFDEDGDPVGVEIFGIDAPDLEEV
jgi:uncharacterized protein YuzE